MPLNFVSVVAPVAQLDRASDYGSEGLGFESLRACHFFVWNIDMIYGIGVDIVEVARIQKSIEKFGDKFLQKIFLEEEISFCQCKPNPAIHFAARFAAKEAFSKALGTGFSDGVSPNQVEVVKSENGKVDIALHFETKKKCESLGIKKINLSISHEKETAIAFVVAEL